MLSVRFELSKDVLRSITTTQAELCKLSQYKLFIFSDIYFLFIYPGINYTVRPFKIRKAGWTGWVKEWPGMIQNERIQTRASKPRTIAAQFVTEGTFYNTGC